MDREEGLRQYRRDKLDRMKLEALWGCGLMVTVFVVIWLISLIITCVR